MKEKRDGEKSHTVEWNRLARWGLEKAFDPVLMACAYEQEAT